MLKFKLPPEAAKYVSLQRLETQALGGSIHYTRFGAAAYRIYELVPFAKQAYRYYSTTIEPQLRSTSINGDYCEIMAREFDTIRKHLGEGLKTVVGIGPGVAGLEVLISHHCRNSGLAPPKIILIDKTGIDPIQFGFHDVAAVYNSLALSRDVLIMNRHPADKVLTVEAEEASDLLDDHAGEVDLVTSLIAWGFHFPVDTYLKLVTQLLRPGGRLILDVRKGTDGMDKFKDAFVSVQVVLDDPKFYRVVAVKS